MADQSMRPGDIGPRFESQARFLACPASFSLFGGAAGGGKTAGLCLDAVQSQHVSGYRGLLLRRSHKDHTMQGGLIDEAHKLWGPLGATFRASSPLEARFASGSSVQFSYPEPGKKYEDQFQGLQASWIGFDEMTHFEWGIVSYLQGRLRNTIGLPDYLRGSCNPDPDHFLREFVDWYLDDAGYADRSKAGIVRWWAVNTDTDELVMAGTRAEVRRRAKCGDESVYSFAFHPSLASDNTVLMETDPHYAARVGSTRVRAERLGRGNWNARDGSGGMLSQQHWEMCTPDDVPKLRCRVRCWDRAATKPSASNTDPDFTASALCGFSYQDRFLAGLGEHGFTAMRDEPGPCWRHIKLTAIADGPTVTQRIPVDPGAAGKDSAEIMREKLRDPRIGPLDFWPMGNSGNKITRGEPLSDCLEQGRGSFVRGPWADRSYVDPKLRTTMERLVWRQLDAFGDGKEHDDIPDCVAGAFLCGRGKRPYKGLGAAGWGVKPVDSTRRAW